MWIKAELFERLIKERAEATGVNLALERMVTSQKATIEFMALRLQQVEHERALLTEKFLGISLPVPVVKNMPSPASVITADDLLNSMPSFEDMGDEAAAAAGIGWDPSGRVVYAKKA
jgi:hypothetical protein